MLRRVVFIVGDRFAIFRQGKDNVQLYSEYVDGLAGRGAAGEAPVTFYVPSQGLSDREVAVVLATASPANRAFLETSGALPGGRSGATHKHKGANVIITEPEARGPDHYTAKLHLDDDCAEMSDHVTGCHLQGMLLIEAARQLFIAVTERHYLADGERGGKYFVINSFDVRYKAFAFPLPTSLDYRVLTVERKARCSRFTAEIDVVQAGASVCEVKVDFAVFDAAPLTSTEVSKSALAVERELSRLTQALELPA